MRKGGDISSFSLLRQLNHGYRGLSLMNWVSSSKLHVSVASILGVAGLILAVKDRKVGSFNSICWPSEREGSSERLWLVPGLQNLGNNCFLNVILQALASCSCFGRFIEKIIQDCSSGEEQVESLPLTFALADLLRDLCTACNGRISFSPQKVMLALNLYIPNFNLTSQQDAAEMFLHLLSSLREEVSECYIQKHSSLADVSAFTNRVLTTKREELSEQFRWQQHFLGPFDGILCSILACQSCSFQISLDYEFFHSLPLPLVLNKGCSAASSQKMFGIFGCTLEDCLKQFIVSEQVENYHCSHCWHVAAMKYLLSINASKPEIEMLRCCTEQDWCRCRNMFHLESLPWSNKFSRTYKQLAIARCPKILCFHLQRASINEFGEPIKVQGHVTFPIILNLLPFMKNGMGTNNQEENVQRGQPKNQHEQPVITQLSEGMISCILGLTGQNIVSEALNGEHMGSSAVNLMGDARMQAFQRKPHLPQPIGCSVTKQENIHMQSDNKARGNGGVTSSSDDAGMFHLVSVVEHSGRAGGGHYTVYRRVGAEPKNDNHDAQFNDPTTMRQWCCVSDSEVRHVSEEDVLAAEATLLFYQRFMG